jgi:hypothetical protein
MSHRAATPPPPLSRSQEHAPLVGESEDFEDALDNLDRYKAPFLDDIQNGVRTFIEDRSRADCLTIVEIRKLNLKEIRRTFRPDKSVEYSARFARFCLGGNPPLYNNNVLDSWLTQPISKVVVDKYEKFFDQHLQAITSGMLQKLGRSESLQQELLSTMLDQLKSESPPLSGEMLDQISDLPSNSFWQHVNEQSESIKDLEFESVVSSSAVTRLDPSTSATLMSGIEEAITTIVIEFMSSKKSSEMIADIAKEAVVQTIVMTVATTFGTMFGIAITGSSMAWMVLPILVALAVVTYNVYGFQSNLAGKVAPAVKKALDDSFRSRNKMFLSAIWRESIEANIPKLASSLVKKPNIVRLLVSRAGSRSSS